MFLCPNCQAELIGRTERATCGYCGAVEQTEWECPAGHYTCEDCRCAEACELVEKACIASKDTDPYELATRLMQHPAFTQAGPEHHLLVAPVVLACVRNSGYSSVTQDGVREAVARMKDIPGGACAQRGDCGGAVGAGVAVSILTNARPLRSKQRSMVLRTTAKAGLALADLGGIRCCKQAVFCGIQTAWIELRSELLPLLPLLELPVCALSGRQKDCKREACPYHG